MKTIGILLSLFCLSSVSAQTNATDVDVTDCDGITYNLFDELDAGKVIVIGWAMPCATCVAPLLDVHNAVLNFAISNPGEVEYWVNDDFANSTCSTIESWCTSNGITNAKYFSDAQLSMYDYGSAGMPKVVVLGCTDHKIYYNKNDNPYGPHVTSAVQNALGEIASGCEQASLEDISATQLQVTCYPNTESSSVVVKISGEFSGQPEFTLIGTSGNTIEVSTVSASSESDFILGTGVLSPGFYFLKVTLDGIDIVSKFQIL